MFQIDNFISLNFPDLSIFSNRSLSKNDQISLISCQPPPQSDLGFSDRTTSPPPTARQSLTFFYPTLHLDLYFAFTPKKTVVNEGCS